MSDSKPPNGSITSFEAIQELCSKPFPVRFKLHGQECQIEVRYLSPIEAELRRTQLEQLFPPIKRGKTEVDDRFDIANPDYLAKKAIVEKEVRAQAIFWCCPEIQKRKPELVDAKYSPANRAAIKEFVNDLKLSEDVLETIYAAICEPPQKIAEVVNFT